MVKFIIRRSIGLLPLLLGVVVISFLLMRAAPGGPQVALAGIKSLTDQDREAWLRRWCLQQINATDPLPVQLGKISLEFGGWLGVINCDNEGGQAFFSEQGNLNFLPGFLGGGDNGIIHGDLGSSIKAGRPVTEVISERIPATLILTTTALILWVGIAILLGTYAAVHRYSLFDQVVTFFAYVFYSLPTFWLGLMLIFFFGVALGLVPTGGIITTRDWPPFNTPQYWEAFGQDPLGAITDIGRHLILPVATLVAVNIAADSRFVRASMLESLGQDYVRTAKAKGLPGRSVIGKHAFRNAMLPVVTNVALELPFLFSGAIVTETIFTWPGMGRLFIDSVGARDYFVLMGLLLVTSIFILLANLLADVLYAVVDPRIRYD
jgi:ABC-type dipeptide/oligopeptide/nickel transport system permease component